MAKYKLNNSYTTYVVDDYEIEKQEQRLNQCNNHNSKIEWKIGAKVVHWHYGKGEICDITDNLISVKFVYKKPYWKKKQFYQIITFEIKDKEISLKLL